jgi:hypothetical protein
LHDGTLSCVSTLLVYVIQDFSRKAILQVSLASLLLKHALTGDCGQLRWDMREMRDLYSSWVDVVELLKFSWGRLKGKRHLICDEIGIQLNLDRFPLQAAGRVVLVL